MDRPRKKVGSAFPGPTLPSVRCLCGLPMTVTHFPLWSVLPSRSSMRWSDSPEAVGGRSLSGGPTSLPATSVPGSGRLQPRRPVSGFLLRASIAICLICLGGSFQEPQGSPAFTTLPPLENSAGPFQAHPNAWFVLASRMLQRSPTRTAFSKRCQLSGSASPYGLQHTRCTLQLCCLPVTAVSAPPEAQRAGMVGG